ncbi:hypothetical protein L195_g050567, partial [Trifolium pratense]
MEKKVESGGFWVKFVWVGKVVVSMEFLRDLEDLGSRGVLLVVNGGIGEEGDEVFVRKDKKKGKEVGESSSRGKGSKRQRKTWVATPSPPHSPTPSPPREDSPPPPPPVVVTEIPRN